MIRSLDDKVAEAMRRERLGFTLPLWADWSEGSKSEWLSRADHLVKILGELGVSVQERKRDA